MIVQLVAEIDPVFYQHLWWSDFYLLLLALHLLQENIFRNTFGWLLLKRKYDVFNKYIISDKRDAFTAAKTRKRIGLKKYLMNRSSCLLLKKKLFKKKRWLAASKINIISYFRSIHGTWIRHLLPEKHSIINLISKVWDIQGITL